MTSRQSFCMTLAVAVVAAAILGQRTFATTHSDVKRSSLLEVVSGQDTLGFSWIHGESDYTIWIMSDEQVDQARKYYANPTTKEVLDDGTTYERPNPQRYGNHAVGTVTTRGADFIGITELEYGNASVVPGNQPIGERLIPMASILHVYRNDN